MRKLQRIFESTPEISFLFPQKEFSLYWDSFLGCDLGKIYQVLPRKELIKNLKLKEQRKGRVSTFSPQGKLSLMFLKAYCGFSDRKLIEHLNGSIQYQLFYGILLGPEKLPDFEIVSKIRSEISRKMIISYTQQILADERNPYIKQPNLVLEDAACYESYIRNPSDLKL
jgi:hypothetical protein